MRAVALYSISRPVNSWRHCVQMNFVVPRNIVYVFVTFRSRVRYYRLKHKRRKACCLLMFLRHRQTPFRLNKTASLHVCLCIWVPIDKGALTDTHGHGKSISCLGHLSWRLAISKNRPLDFYASLLSGTYRSKCKNNKKSITTDAWVLFFAFLGVFAVILPFLYRFCGQNYKKLQFLARLLLAM